MTEQQVIVAAAEADAAAAWLATLEEIAGLVDEIAARVKSGEMSVAGGDDEAFMAETALFRADLVEMIARRRALD